MGRNSPQPNAGLRGILYNGQKQQNRHELFVRAGFALYLCIKRKEQTLSEQNQY